MRPDEPNGRQGADGQGPPSDPAFLDRFKEFFLTTFAVDHRTTVLVLLFIVTFGGIAAYVSIPKEAAPEIEIPIIAVVNAG